MNTLFLALKQEDNDLWLIADNGGNVVADNLVKNDAWLLAAAPQMCEALSELVAAIENVDRHVGLLSGERARLERAKAAISIARTGGASA